MFLAARGLRDPELGGERRFEREFDLLVRRQAGSVWRRSAIAALLLTAAAWFAGQILR